VDDTGNTYITGSTQSNDFPTTVGTYDTTYNNNTDVFVTKYDSVGAMVYSTYLGGTNIDTSADIVVDSAANAYITGVTRSADYPTTAGAFDTSQNGSNDVFVTKINPAGTALIFSTFFGGTSYEKGNALAIDSSGNSYITGYTASNDFPLQNPLDNSLDSQDAFITKLNSTGTALIYSTYLGGTDGEDVNGERIVVNNAGEVIVAIETQSIDLPLVNPLYTINAASEDIFIAQLDVSGTSILFSTYFGSDSSDLVNGLALDSSGNLFIAGSTGGNGFPIKNAYDSTKATNTDGFLAKISGFATTAATAIPTLSQWSLIIVTLLLGFFGVYFVDRKMKLNEPFA